MKKLMLVLAMGAFGFTAANAQQTTPPPQQQQQQEQHQQQQRTQQQQQRGVQEGQTQRMEIRDLPESVRESIDSKREDRDAQIISVDREMREGEQYYEVTFRKDDRTYTKKYDNEGNEVDKDGKKRDD